MHFGNFCHHSNTLSALWVCATCVKFDYQAGAIPPRASTALVLTRYVGKGGFRLLVKLIIRSPTQLFSEPYIVIGKPERNKTLQWIHHTWLSISLSLILLRKLFGKYIKILQKTKQSKYPLSIYFSGSASAVLYYIIFNTLRTAW